MCGGPEHSKPVLGSKTYGIMLADGAASRSSFAHSEASLKQQSSWSHGGKDFHGESSCVSLLELAADNDLEAFRLSVEDDGMDLDEPDNWYVRVIAIGKMALEKRTPMMIAALYGSVEVLGYILESGRVDANRVCGDDNVTALHCAAAGGSPRAAEVVQLLLRAGANKSAVDGHGRRPVEVILVPPKLPYVRAALENMLAEAHSSFECEAIECRNGHQSDGGAASGVSEKDVDDVVTVFGEARDGFISISSASSPCSSPGSTSPKLSPQYPSSPKFAEIPSDGSDKARDYPVDPSLPDIKNSIYTTDEFRMFSFKVRPCSRAYSHDWTECPFVHPGENARRRDPRRYHYSCVPCPDFRKGSCRRGDACEYAHGVFECWLHPAQYRTRSCKDGTNCTRRVCFFAHTSEEMRPLYVSMGSAVPSPRASSPLDARSMSPPLSAVSQSPVLMVPPFSPSNASGSGLSTPPLSPSASSLGGSWSQPNVPTLHLPGGAGLHVSRLRAAVSARDIQSDDFTRNSDFEGHLASEFSSLSTHGRQNSSAVLMGSGSSSGRMHKFGSLGLNIPATNLQDLFCSEVSPMSPVHQSQLNAQDHPSLSQQLHSQLQLQQLLSPLSPMSHVSPSSGQSIFSGGSPRSIPSRRCDSELQSSPGASLSADVINARKSAAFAQRERGSWSLKDYSGSIPSPSWSDWGSPSGKPDWGVQGQDIGKFRKSASFASHGGAEPDLSWVQTLVKDGPVELESSGSSPQSSGKMHPENVDCLVGGGWVEQQTHNNNQMV